MKNKFNIGDKVKIINHGEQYTNYKIMENYFQIDKKHKGDQLYVNGLIGNVRNYRKHFQYNSSSGVYNAILCDFVAPNKKHYIIGEKGLELIQKLTLEEKLEKLVEMSIKRRFQTKHHYLLFKMGGIELLFFERFKMERYLHEYKQLSLGYSSLIDKIKDKLDNYLLEIIRNDLPELWGTKIKFSDSALRQNNSMIYTI